jgi:hypothetical protein
MCVIVMVTGSVSKAQSTYSPEEEVAMRAWYVSNTACGTIVVTGLVVDAESGRALSQVRVAVDTVLGVPMVSSHVVSTQMVANGSFAVSCKNCSAIGLMFDREGYQSSMSSIAFETEPVEYDWKTKTFVRSTDVYTTNLVVRMQADGMDEELVAGSSVLRLADRGEASALAWNNGEWVDVRSSNAFVSGAWTTPGFYLVANTGAEGRILLDTNSIAVGTRLIMATGDGDGFVAYSADGLDLSRVSARMREAPPTGYVRELPVKAGDLYTYFYFRVAGFYGKGYVASLMPKWGDEDTISVSCSVFVQTNGTRTLGSRPGAGTPGDIMQGDGGESAIFVRLPRWLFFAAGIGCLIAAIGLVLYLAVYLRRTSR